MVTCDLRVWHQPVTVCANTDGGSAGRGWARCRSGYRMSGPPRLSPRRIAGRPPSPPVNQSPTTRRSWTRSSANTTPGRKPDRGAARLYTAAGRGVYPGNPRRVLIVQGDRFDATASTTVCPLTTNPTEVPLTRIPSEASPLHGLNQPSRLMVDKVMPMPRSNLREHLGRLPETDLVRLNRSLIEIRVGRPETRRGNRDPIEENVSQGSPGCSCPRCSVSCARVM